MAEGSGGRGRYARAKARSTDRTRPTSRWWLWPAGGAAAVLIALGLFARSGRNTVGVPAGTQVFAETNHQHVTGEPTYDRTPPAGGPHNAVWLNCGIYDQPVPNANAVHSLEHGSVWITYLPSLAVSEVDQLRSIMQSHYVGPQKYLILSPYPGLPSLIVASAWGAQLRLSSVSDPRLIQFIDHVAGRSQGGEPGGRCTGGIGTPAG